MKRALLILSLFVVAAIVFVALRPKEAPEPDNAVTKDQLHSRSGGAETPSLPPPAPALERLDMAQDLNAPSKTIQDDLRTLDGVFLAWQSNFLKEGNPVGENGEITAALTGKNSLHLAFLAPNHPAINTKGELCDRWGTPFFFHQESGSKMKIVSAGPDRKRGTADDVVFTP